MIESKSSTVTNARTLSAWEMGAIMDRSHAQAISIIAKASAEVIAAHGEYSYEAWLFRGIEGGVRAYHEELRYDMVGPIYMHHNKEYGYYTSFVDFDTCHPEEHLRDGYYAVCVNRDGSIEWTLNDGECDEDHEPPSYIRDALLSAVMDLMGVTQ